MRWALAAGAALVFLAGAAEARTWRIEPGPNAQAELQQALIEARPGDTVRLDDGRYVLSAGLSLDVDRVTIRGEGHDRTILDFSNQRQGAEGLMVTSDRVTLRDFAVENAKGDAIKAQGCDQISFIRVRAEWTGGPSPNNGAYGLYPVNCTNVLIEESIARGASDAGIYVGQSRNIIVRASLAELNVAGIEIENSFNADVYRNTTTRNTGGILVFDLPGLPQVGGHSVRVFENRIVDNNTDNFAPEGNIVAGVPSGTGVLVMANRNVHIFDNEIGDNGTVNVMLIAYRGEIPDTRYNPLPRDIVIRDNSFGRVGFAPDGDLAALAQMGVALPDVIWDGAEIYSAAGAPQTEPVRITMQNNAAPGRAPTFLSLGVPVAGAALSEAQPRMEMPPAASVEAPARVRLPQD
ncbi:MAG: right-handed parallel beta-helix repeat-containing protein [Hydrogenophilaceae bacterium]|nr:right-handed parallel beta-helix repeat-containing protein [Hydrogenophilaceae bacterium]